MSVGAARYLAVVAVLSGALGATAALVVLPHAHFGIFGRPSVTGSATRTTGIARIGGPFNLIAQTGARITDKDLHGRLLLVTFGYSRSRNITPVSLQVVTDALNSLGPRARNVQPVFITLDPEHDTPQRLAAFMTRFHPSFLALSGPRAEIEMLAAAYFVHLSRKTAGERITYTANIFVMNRTGDYVTHFPFATPVTNIVSRLREVSR